MMALGASVRLRLRLRVSDSVVCASMLFLLFWSALLVLVAAGPKFAADLTPIPAGLDLRSRSAWITSLQNVRRELDFLRFNSLDQTPMEAHRKFALPVTLPSGDVVHLGLTQLRTKEINEEQEAKKNAQPQQQPRSPMGSSGQGPRASPVLFSSSSYERAATSGTPSPSATPPASASASAATGTGTGTGTGTATATATATAPNKFKLTDTDKLSGWELNLYAYAMYDEAGRELISLPISNDGLRYGGFPIVDVQRDFTPEAVDLIESKDEPQRTEAFHKFFPLIEALRFATAEEAFGEKIEQPGSPINFGAPRFQTDRVDWEAIDKAAKRAEDEIKRSSGAAGGEAESVTSTPKSKEEEEQERMERKRLAEERMKQLAEAARMKREEEQRRREEEKKQKEQEKAEKMAEAARVKQMTPEERQKYDKQKKEEFEKKKNEEAAKKKAEQMAKAQQNEEDKAVQKQARETERKKKEADKQKKEMRDKRTAEVKQIIASGGTVPEKLQHLFHAWVELSQEYVSAVSSALREPSKAVQSIADPARNAEIRLLHSKKFVELFEYLKKLGLTPREMTDLIHPTPAAGPPSAPASSSHAHARTPPATAATTTAGQKPASGSGSGSGAGDGAGAGPRSSKGESQAQAGMEEKQERVQEQGRSVSGKADKRKARDRKKVIIDEADRSKAEQQQQPVSTPPPAPAPAPASGSEEEKQTKGQESQHTS